MKKGARMGAKATKEIGEEGELEDSKFSQQDHRQSGPKVSNDSAYLGGQKTSYPARKSSERSGFWQRSSEDVTSSTDARGSDISMSGRPSSSNDTSNSPYSILPQRLSSNWQSVGAKDVGQSQHSSLESLMEGKLCLADLPPAVDDAGLGRPRPSGERYSIDSNASVHSKRSSFAIERASQETNRASLEIFRVHMSHPVAPAAGLPGRGAYKELEVVPEGLREHYMCLAVVPPDTPLPMCMLARLWNLADENDAEASANMLESRGIVKVASLYDGSVWALLQPEHMENLSAVAAASEEIHRRLIASYLEGHTSLTAVLDDGYWMQNVGHHLVRGNMIADLKSLLMNPGWLEQKLHAYGVNSVVADFRRYLMINSDDEVKLLLEAFQLSVGACLQYPDISMLQGQMVGRLTVLSQTHLKDWLASAAAAASSPSDKVRCLLVKTPSLEQAGGLQRMALRGHTAGVMKVMLTACGIDVITASADGTTRVWDMEIGDCVLLLEGHTGPVTDLDASEDSAILVTASADCTARVWELERGACLQVLAGHTGMLNAVAVDKLSRFCVTASADGTARVWELASGVCAHVLRGHGTEAGLSGVLWSVALTPDCRQAVTTSEDHTARVWSIASGKCLHVLAGHTGWVVHVAIPKGGSRAITASHDGTARVWDLWNGMCEHVLKGHTGRLNAVRLSGAGNMAVTVSDDHTARVWDWSTGECAHVLRGHGAWVSNVAVTQGGSRGVTASGDDLAVVWDLQAGVCVNVLEGHTGEVRSVVLTRRGRFAVTGSEDKTARVWDLQAGSTHAQRSHNGPIHNVLVSSDGATAVTLGDDGSALIWDAASGAWRSEIRGHSAGLRWAAIQGDGNHLLAAYGDRFVRRCNIGTSECTTVLEPVQGSRVKSFAASADGSVAVIVLFDSSISVWDLNTQECRCQLQRRGDRDAARVHSGGVNAAFMTADGRWVVTVSKDCTARIWDVEQGCSAHILEGHTQGVTTAALTRDGKKVVTVAEESTAMVWDMATGKCLFCLPHTHRVQEAAVSGCGKMVATVSADNDIWVWDLDTGERIQQLTGHTDTISFAVFSKDSTLLATCSADRTARVWDPLTGALAGFFVADTSLTACAFAGPPHPETLLAGGAEGGVHFLQLPSD